MDKIFRVNMTDLTTTVEDVPAEWAGLGGRALTSTIVATEVDPECHPLGEKNKLVFAPGLLSGTAAAQSGRMSCGAKSPLTGGIKESNAGGTTAQQFARMGIKAMIIEGMPKEDKFYSLHITKDGVTIAEESELLGSGNFAVIDAMVEKYDKKIGVMTIGLPGELKMASANISVKDPDGKIRSHGRGGMGAVMGSKKIKFMTVDSEGAGAVPIADPDTFKKAARVFAKAMLDHPVSGEGLPTYGTNVLVNILNEAGGLPTRNFTYGQFDAHDNISGETMHDTIVERGGSPKHGCHKGCIIQCSQVYNDKDGNYVTSGFEYETIWGMGANCCVENLDEIAEADNIMDDIGVDSIETVVMFGVAMEAGILPFGDGKGILRMLREEIGKGTPLGRILGGGAGNVGRTYGVTRVPVVKNQGIPAYDPRSVKGIGITYATSTMGADHTSGYTIATNILNVGGFVDPLSKDGQVELSRNLQIATAAIDSTGMCIFVAFPALDIPECLPALIDMINARFGCELTGDDVTELGKKVLKLEHQFNLDAGMTNKDDRLPEFFKTDPVPPHNAIWDFSDEEIDEFWNF
ncbi:aldehyde ferredoxin oxidoreductase family protein [Desulfuromonas acetoxidans]|uniref:Aldehyde ferredoxin oxidoreductase n=1 Tax=Desulfuromonas acetoxidans (strain DSM 684 / 11070) TaxID=281689 RepID=Q1JZL4_DESA6|nr:aldehyde ferredoxin oxidoreductase C-terminal domain-containing protein [Desulfuromonas acetoxidans]EAT15553.1 aldehyde ferredoxin oxidoreductase [Desulfuromonas acetoxidans DSM 684]MBF0646068.1 aldehyde ferredoxin oxidoreductase [Desulfuromonas acetoxidans]NVD25144.1 aldehyde ferredoxin oxidoreductase [Desulfuromonas acetoxidans]NVE17234.1 aldehyde ferredoxin oxidoreductase [Desulfuromonas acetoxidans]